MVREDRGGGGGQGSTPYPLSMVGEDRGGGGGAGFNPLPPLIFFIWPHLTPPSAHFRQKPTYPAPLTPGPRPRSFPT